MEKAIDILDKLYESGDLYELAKSGLIATNVLISRKIFKAYEFQLLNGVGRAQAITDVGDVFGVSDRTVYRVINKFK